MVIVQNDKRKVLDYQDLNEHVDTYTAYANMCVQKQCVCIGSTKGLPTDTCTPITVAISNHNL